MEEPQTLDCGAGVVSASTLTCKMHKFSQKGAIFSFLDSEIKQVGKQSDSTRYAANVCTSIESICLYLLGSNGL